MPTLHFGVVDLPYSSGKGRARGAASATSTYDVAKILEAHYGLFQTYYNLRSKMIADELGRSYVGALNSLMNGAPATHDPAGSASALIEADFRDMVTRRQFDGQIPGVPTQAATTGVSRRFKRPHATGRKRGERPSFVDTGLFLSAVRVWVD